MAKAKAKSAKESVGESAKSAPRFLVGGNLSDGSRFEAGQDASGIPKKDYEALKDIIVEDK